MIITSKSNSTVKEIASLKDKKFRKKSGTFVVEGYKMVNEAIRSGKEIRLLVATEEAVKRFEEYNLKTLTVTDEVFSFLSDAVTPQGVLAVLKRNKNPR